jgi:CDP-diacylglycerol--glycerol-3-phosphate 3-phosphatidyltransferase
MRNVLSRMVGDPGARLLGRMGLTPNMVTLLGLLFSGATAYLIASERLVAAGILLLFSALFDHLDGALARLTDRTTVFGAFLDSVVDRMTEAMVLFGMLLLALGRGSDTLAILVFLAFGFSVMVSYTRARAEGLGVSGEVGILTRPERVVLLVVGLVADGLTGHVALIAALGIIGALSLVTTLQRVAYAWRGLRDRD